MNIDSKTVSDGMNDKVREYQEKLQGSLKTAKEEAAKNVPSK